MMSNNTLSNIPESNHAQVTDDPLSNEADALGLDKPIKLKTRAKIARLDNQAIFSPNGLPYIVKHHTKLIRTIQKNDKNFKKELSRYPQKIRRQQKLDHEYNNLASILQFYQLWCHGLFPKATFKDCIHLIRALGAKSPQLRQYRYQLIQQELYKLKVAKGIIDENPDNEQNDVQDDDIYESRTNGLEEDNDDWSWMHTEAITAESVANWSNEQSQTNNNGLFVQEDDETETAKNQEEYPFDDEDLMSKTNNKERDEELELELELMREYS